VTSGRDPGTAAGEDAQATCLDITRIRLRFLFAAESYLLRGAGGSILIDTGLSTRRRRLLDRLRDAGCEPSELVLVVLTHAHADHAGNCAFLQSAYGVPIAVHEGDVGKVERGDMFWTPDGRPPLGVSVAKVLLAPFGMARFGPFVPDVVLAEGQDLREYSLAATVVHLPGHSPGSIGILTDGGELFCGDLLTGTGGPSRNTIIDDTADYAASVERLRELDVRTVYPGHGEPFALEDLWEPERAGAH
jgi:glyoxylase-like metal-dependent hydrolase (beta-lactamase superfamily II)